MPVGGGRMLKDFEDGLKGANAGETRTVPVRFPDDYGKAELAGKTAQFTIAVKSAEEMQLPEVDASFIRGFGIDSGAVDEFHAEVRRNMENEFAGRSRSDVKRQLLDKLLAANPVALPEMLVEQECAGLQSEAMRNLGIEDPRQAPDRKSFRPNAERRVRLGLLIGEIIRAEKITPERDRVLQRIDQVAAGYSQPEEVRKAYQQNRDLVSVGAYRRGSDPRIDHAIDAWPRLQEFLRQDMYESVTLHEALPQLRELLAGAAPR